MSDVALNNTSSGLSGKTVLAADVDATITSLHTFNRGSGSAPLAIGSGAAVVPNLDADKVDGLEAAALGRLASAGTWTAAQQFPAGTVSAPGVGVGDSDVGLYSSGTNALDFTTNGVKALGIDSTQFVDSPTQPRCSAYRLTVQSIASAITTAVLFDAEDFDVTAIHDTSSNTSRFTIPTGGDGLYFLNGKVTFAPSAVGNRQLLLKKNGATNLDYRQYSPATSYTIVGISGIYNLVAGDYVELYAYQDSGGALDIGFTNREAANVMQIVKLW